MSLTLRKILAESWCSVKEAAGKSDHAFRNFIVAHQGTGGINAYTVVLRAADAEAHQLVFYTDARSEKVGQLQADNHITAVFYDRQEQIQVIVRGQAIIDTQNEITLQHWNTSGYKGRTSYLADQPPSTPIAQPADGLEYIQGKQFLDEDRAGYENFAVVTIMATQTEYLKLNRTDGNRRARFNLLNNDWQGSWIIP